MAIVRSTPFGMSTSAAAPLEGRGGETSQAGLATQAGRAGGRP
jgi:hypothetical protein